MYILFEVLDPSGNYQVTTKDEAGVDIGTPIEFNKADYRVDITPTYVAVRKVESSQDSMPPANSWPMDRVIFIDHSQQPPV